MATSTNQLLDLRASHHHVTHFRKIAGTTMACNVHLVQLMANWHQHAVTVDLADVADAVGFLAISDPFKLCCDGSIVTNVADHPPNRHSQRIKA